MNLKSLILAVIVLMVVPFVSGALTDGLVAYYSFDNDTRDDTGNGHNGTPNAKANKNSTYYKLGGSSYSFETDVSGPDSTAGRIELANYNDFIPTSGSPQFSSCAWTRLRDPAPSTPSNNGPIGIAALRNDGYVTCPSGSIGSLCGHGFIDYDDEYPNWRLMIWIAYTSGDYWSYYQSAYDYIHIDENTWTHMCLVQNATHLNTYKNGTLKVSVANTAGAIYPAGYAYIGSFGANGANSYNYLGEQDEIGYWSRALDSTEVSGLYNNGTGLNPFAQETQISSVNIAPSSPYVNQTLNCNVTTTQSTNINLTWFVSENGNGTYSRNSSFDAQAISVSSVLTTLGNGSFPAEHSVGAMYICQATIPGQSMNSSNVTTQQIPCSRPEYTIHQQTQTNYTDLTGGWIGLGNLFDGSYSTFASGNIMDGVAQVQIEYAKPQYTFGAYWEVSNQNGDYGDSYKNSTLPDDCWNAYTDRLILAAWSATGLGLGGGNARRWLCYNGTSWVSYSGAYGGTPNYMMEESVYWKYYIAPSINLTSYLPTLDVSPVPNFYINTTLSYSNLTTNECQVNENADWISCTNITHGWCSTQKASVCTVTGHHEASVRFNVTCEQGIKSSDLIIYIDADSNPVVTTNSESAYSNTPNIPFQFQINATNWVETPTCGLIGIDPILSCGVGIMAAQGGNRYLGTATCQGSNSTQVNMTYYVQCNGTSIYQQINSSLIELTYDPVGPTITLSNFTGNGSWFAKNITGQWDFYDLNLYRINVSIDGNPIFQQSGINATNYTYILDHYVGDLVPGFHEFEIWMFDSHTKRDLQDEWTVSTPILSDKLVFTPKRKGIPQARIEIESADENNFINPWEAKKLKDKYTFTFDTDKKVEEPSTFIVKSDLPIDIISNPNTKWKMWAVTGEYWVDFYMDDGSKTTVERIDEYTVRFIVEGKSKPKDEGEEEKDGVKEEKDVGKMVFESVGELNSVHEHYYFNTYNVSLMYRSSIPEGSSQVVSMALDYGNNTPTYNVSLQYAGTPVSYTSNDTGSSILFNSSSFYSSVISVTQNVSGAWNIQMPYEENNVTFSQIVVKIGTEFGGCENESFMRSISFHGRDEQTDENVTFDMNIHFSLWTDNILVVSDLHLEFRNESTYNICLYPNETIYNMEAILEYEATGYSHRKYYLYNTTLSDVHQDVYLYLLPSVDTTEVIAYVLDAQTTEPISGAFIRVLRYYPGRINSYSQVEVAETDNEGRTVIKQTVVDVFYKYIIEYPSGEIRLETDVQKVLTATKTFLINIMASSNFDVWNRVQHMSTQVSCTESTTTCRFTWANQGLTARTATLKVYKELGYSRQLLSQQSLTASSGTLVYVIPGYENNTMYTAEAYVEGYDDHMYPGGTDSVITVDNPMKNNDFTLALLFPFLLLVIVLGSAFLDIGTIGVTIGALVALIAGWMVGVIPFDVRTGIPLVVMIFVILFKLSRE